MDVKREITAAQRIWKNIRWLIPVPVLIVIAAILNSSFDQNTVQINGQTLVISEVVFKPFREQVSCDGIIMPSRKVFIDATLNGKVINRFTINGVHINEGEPIIELENTDLELDILNKETQVLELINNINFTNITFEQNKVARLNELADTRFAFLESEREFQVNERLFRNGAIAENEYKSVANRFNYLEEKLSLLQKAVVNDSLTAVAQLKQMKISLEQAQKNLDLMKSKMDALVVKAPISGQLSSFQLEEGELVSVGENIGQIDVLDDFIIEAQVDQHFLNRTIIGQSATASINGTHYDLSIQFINPTIENNFFRVDLKFNDDLPEGIKRGQLTRVKIHLSGEENTLTLKKGSFYQSSGGRFAYVLNEDGLAEKRPIQIGRQNEDEYEVVEGLQAGEQVITSTYNEFKDYESIQIE